MRFHHRFTVQSHLQAVADFHLHPQVLRQITPPPTILHLHHAPDPIRQGDSLAFTLWIGPFPVYWESHFPEVTPTGFLDTQGRGPFRSWQHRHTFVPIDVQATDIVDEIEAHLRPHPYYGPVGLLMWLSLPFLFAYRKWKTRRLLRRK